MHRQIGVLGRYPSRRPWILVTPAMLAMAVGCDMGFIL
jgi:hypothetical protein